MDGKRLISYLFGSKKSGNDKDCADKLKKKNKKGKDSKGGDAQEEVRPSTTDTKINGNDVTYSAFGRQAASPPSQPPRSRTGSSSHVDPSSIQICPASPVLDDIVKAPGSASASNRNSLTSVDKRRGNGDCKKTCASGDNGKNPGSPAVDSDSSGSPSDRTGEHRHHHHHHHHKSGSQTQSQRSNSSKHGNGVDSDEGDDSLIRTRQGSCLLDASAPPCSTCLFDPKEPPANSRSFARKKTRGKRNGTPFVDADGHSLVIGPAPQGIRGDVATVMDLTALHKHFKLIMKGCTENEKRRKVVDKLRGYAVKLKSENTVLTIKDVQGIPEVSISSMLESIFNLPQKFRMRYALALDRFCDVQLDELEESTMAGMGGLLMGMRGGFGMPMTNSDAQEYPSPAPISNFDLSSVFHKLLFSDVLPPLEDVLEVMRVAKETFNMEANVVSVPVPCVIVGDIHGQINDLRENVLGVGGPLGEAPYLFLGDYVDRGPASVHCICLLVAAKVMFPEKVFLLRGNHEGRMTNRVYGFLQECHTRYPLPQSADDALDDFWNLPSHPLADLANRVFDCLPIAAIIGGCIMGMHGGLSPQATTIDAIIAIDRHHDIESGALADLTWSDPMESSGFTPSSRGCGHLFGSDTTEMFLHDNNLEFIVRAHQCVREGFMWSQNQKVLTVFSAPNYCGQGNKGAVVLLHPNLMAECVQYGDDDVSASPLKEVPKSFI